MQNSGNCLALYTASYTWKH